MVSISRRPRILYVCPAWPHDHTYGGQLRALHIGRALKQVGHVHLLVIDAVPTGADAIEKTAAEFSLLGHIKGFKAETRSVGARLDWALNPRCNNAHGVLAGGDELLRLDHRVADADLVWFLKLRAANIPGRWHWPRSVMDIDDIPSVFADATRESTDRISGRVKAGLHTWIFRRRERLLLERFSVLSVCSEKDKRYLGFADRVHVVPNGFERPTCDPTYEPRQPPRIGFMGLFSYAPNSEGVRWFVDRCWPILKQSVPGIRLRLMGTGTDGPLKPNDPAIDGLGWVADAAAEIATWTAMIVPIHSGAGTRIKLPHAFSRRCPVVSTSFGAYGYQVEHGKHLLLANDPLSFAQSCLQLVQSPNFARDLAERAWQEFLRNWTWDAIAPSVTAAAEDCLRRASPLSAA
jgi:polysaccharide biosynthesis protein PslH